MCRLRGNQRVALGSGETVLMWTVAGSRGGSGGGGSDTADTLGSAMGLFPLERIPRMIQKSYQ